MDRLLDEVIIGELSSFVSSVVNGVVVGAGRTVVVVEAIVGQVCLTVGGGGDFDKGIGEEPDKDWSFFTRNISQIATLQITGDLQAWFTEVSVCE